MLKKVALSIAIPVLFASGLLATAYGQPKSGTLSGTVVDPSGALIPHAQVIISGATGLSRTIQTDSVGRFEADGLESGSYSISVSADGFTPELEGGIQVSNGEAARETVRLGISVNQEIDVFSDEVSFPGAQVGGEHSTSSTQ